MNLRTIGVAGPWITPGQQPCCLFTPFPKRTTVRHDRIFEIGVAEVGFIDIGAHQYGIFEDSAG
jgi:hypothetical protein